MNVDMVNAILVLIMIAYACTDPECFVRVCPVFTQFFLFFFEIDEGRENPNTTLSVPTLDLQGNTI